MITDGAYLHHIFDTYSSMNNAFKLLIYILIGLLYIQGPIWNIKYVTTQHIC